MYACCIGVVLLWVSVVAAEYEWWCLFGGMRYATRNDNGDGERGRGQKGKEKTANRYEVGGKEGQKLMRTIVVARLCFDASKSKRVHCDGGGR